MIDFRPILLTLGYLLIAVGAAMALPALTDIANDNDDWIVFARAAALTLFAGGTLIFAFRGTGDALTTREAFIMTSLAWLVLPAFAAIPLAQSELALSYTDAFFEAMSGLTTTGSTVITGLDAAPPGLLLWRGILQWLGGVGIVVMAVAVLPMLQIGGMQLFQVESFEITEKLLPRASQMAKGISVIYIAVSFVCFAALWAAGMTPTDAFIHMMSTVSTGGYSSHDASIGHFNSVAIEMIVILFMVIGALPFLVYLQMIRGRPAALWRDSQVRWFFYILAVLILGLSLWLVTFKGAFFGEALRLTSFNIISIMTGTGFSSTDYGTWGSFAGAVFFFVMLIGGCAGSTSCGLKVFRFQILFRSMGAAIRRQSMPHAMFLAYYGNRPISRDVRNSVVSFLLLFLLSFIVLTIALTATGLDFITAFSGAGTALANVGPGLGPIIGPAGNFADLPDSAKWLLSAGMLVGRLELLTIFVLLTPSFWRA